MAVKVGMAVSGCNTDWHFVIYSAELGSVMGLLPDSIAESER